jgi:hypothetical protein
MAGRTRISGPETGFSNPIFPSFADDCVEHYRTFDPVG